MATLDYGYGALVWSWPVISPSQVTLTCPVLQATWESLDFLRYSAAKYAVVHAVYGCQGQELRNVRRGFFFRQWLELRQP